MVKIQTKARKEEGARIETETEVGIDEKRTIGIGGDMAKTERDTGRMMVNPDGIRIGREVPEETGTLAGIMIGTETETGKVKETETRIARGKEKGTQSETRTGTEIEIGIVIVIESGEEIETMITTGGGVAERGGNTSLALPSFKQYLQGVFVKIIFFV